MKPKNSQAQPLPAVNASETRSDASPLRSTTLIDNEFCRDRPKIETVDALLAVGGPFTAEGKLLLAERDAARAEVARLGRELAEAFKTAGWVKLRSMAAQVAMHAGLRAETLKALKTLAERNAGLAAALREAKKLGTHRVAAGDDYACDVADIVDEALAKFGGAE